jgi:endonuclease-3
MPRESKAAKRERAIEVCRRMEERYPGVGAALDFVNPYQLLIAVLLSAQTTDANVNRTTPELFRRWPEPADLAAAPQSEVEEVIHSCGFFHTKAAHAIACAQMIVADYGGEVPHTMEELCKLPGVGRKTANIVLNEGFGIVEGIAVDTHVYRLATRLGFTRAATPTECEQDLLKLLPRELWKPVNSQWIRFGREVCDARKPLCGECMLADLCPSAGKTGNPTSKSKARTKSKAKPRSRSKGK